MKSTSTRVGKVVSVSIQKGGPGKSTICRNLAEEISRTGLKVCIIDNDPQGNLTKYVFGDDLPESIMKIGESSTRNAQKVLPGLSNAFWLYETDEMPEPVKIAENLYLIGTTKHLAEMASKPVSVIYEFKSKMDVLRDNYDLILIDCPPAAGNLQTAAHAGSDFVLAPTLLAEDSLDGLKEQLLTMKANKKNLNPDLKLLGIIVNGKDSHRILIEEHLLDILIDTYGDFVLRPFINSSVKVAEARSMNKIVSDHAPTSIQAKQFKELRDVVLERLNLSLAE